MSSESAVSVVRRRLLGVAYIAMIIGLISLSVMVYNKDFSTFTVVTLHADHTGNALQKQSDVKERGVIVGFVKDIRTTGDGTIVTLDLDPNKVGLIPSNVKAQILPKTLFGEQYVALQYPTDPSGQHIVAGATIEQDTSAAALEAQTVLGDTLPLLQAVKPAELNATLTAIAQALQNRGENLGKTLVTLDNYLKQFNPHTGKLIDDLNKLGQVADEYNAAAPDIVASLDNFETGVQTVIQKKAAIDAILTTATSTSAVFQQFLAENQDKIISVSGSTSQIFGLLDTYSPELGCVVQGLNVLEDRLVKGMAGHQVHLSAQTYYPPNGLGAYTAGQEPKLISGYGPTCFGLPNPQVPLKIPGKYRCVNDGAPLTSDACAQNAASTSSTRSALAVQAQAATTNLLISGAMGVAPNQVPSIATMLAEPLYEGTEVTVK
jgi:virulence factor Mce-like protein